MSSPAAAAVTLETDFTAPATYTPGDTGIEYVIRIENDGSDPANDVDIVTNFPAGAVVRSVSCTDDGDDDTSCDTTRSGGNLASNNSDIVADGFIEFRLSVDFASSLTADPLFFDVRVIDAGASFTGDGADSCPSGSCSIGSTLALESDLGVTKTADASTYVPGQTGTYSIIVTNDGPSDATGVTLTDANPAGTSIDSWSCSASGGASCPAPLGSGSTQTFDLTAGGSLDFTLTLDYPSNLTAASLTNEATVSADVGTSGSLPNTDSDSVTRAAVVDLQTSVTSAAAGYVPGTTGNSASLTVANAGPSDALGAEFSFDVPAEIDELDWACGMGASCTPMSGTASGGDTVTIDVDVPASGSVVVSLTGIDYDSGALADPLELTATAAKASSDSETDASDNAATISQDIDRQADLQITKVANTATANPGDAYEYTILVTNLGPSDLGNGVDEGGVRVTDLVSGDLLVDPGETRCSSDSSAPCFLFCPSDEGAAGSALTIESGECPVEPREVRGDLAPTVDEPDRNALRLSAGSSTEIKLFVSVAGTATNVPEILNTASVEVDAADSVTELNPAVDNEDDATVIIDVASDLIVTVDDGLMEATPGESQSYTVVVTNSGTQAAAGVDVDVDFSLAGDPAGSAFLNGDVAWECRAFNGACCSSPASAGQCGITQAVSGSGELQGRQVDLPGQGRVEFTFTGDLDPQARGTALATASATLPAGITEIDPTDNTDIQDETDLEPESQLRLTKDLLSIVPQTSGASLLTYQIDISNLGPSFADDAGVVDTLADSNLDPNNAMQPASWSCSVIEGPGAPPPTAPPVSCGSGSGPLDRDGMSNPNVTVDLDVGTKVRFTVEVLTVENPDEPLQVTNTASVTVEGGSTSDTITSNLIAEGDLEITVTDGVDQAVPGTPQSYTVTIQNVGEESVFDANVRNDFPPELENVVWSCDAITPIPGDLDEFDAAGPSGTLGAAVVASADGRHIYQLAPSLNRIYAYARNSVPGLDFGAINELEFEQEGENDSSDAGQTVENMDGPVDLAISPDGRHVYVLSQADPSGEAENAIVVFNRDANPASDDFGKLSFAGSTTEGIPAVPRSLVVSSDNLFVAGDSASISIYARSDATGLASFIETQTLNVPANPSALALDVADKLLFAVSGTGAQLSLFSVNDDDTAGDPIGRLTWLDRDLTSASLTGATDLDLVPSADDLYVTASGSGNLVAVRYVDGDSDDIPDPAVLAPYAVAGLAAADVSPDGEHVLVVSPGSDTLTWFRRDVVNGTLSERKSLSRSFDGGAPPSCLGECTLAAPADVLVTSDGRHVLLANSESGSVPILGVYTRRAPDPLFALIEVDRDTDPGTPQDVDGPDLEAPADIAVSPDGEHVYAISLSEGSIALYERNEDAGLTELTAGGHLVFVQDWTEGDAAGSSVIAGMSRPEYLTISPDGLSVIVSSQDGDSLAVFRRNPDGTLEFKQALFDGVGGVEGLAGARGMAMDPDSQHLYVAGGFDAAVAIFERNASFEFEWIGQAQNGLGFNNLTGVRDVAVSPDGSQVYAVSEVDDALVAMERDENGGLTFLQAVTALVGDRPMAVAVSPGAGDHVYVAAQNSDSITVFRRITASGDDFGTLTNARQQRNLEDDIAFMNGPRDLEVSPDGKRVYVAAQFDSSVLVFDRDLNRNGGNFGALSPVAVSRDNVDGVDGIGGIYALAISPDSDNVYAAGFSDRAISSFVLGIGSVCTGGGSGTIDDLVTLGVGGFVQYRVNADIRADAEGDLVNTATVTLPDNVSDPTQPGVANPSRSATDTTTLTPRADLVLTKTNDQISVVSGQPVTYRIQVANLGPSNVRFETSNVQVTDVLDGDDFDVASAVWSCTASSSGALSFAESFIEGTEEGDPNFGLEGVSSVVLVADSDGTGPLGTYLATASVDDGAISLFERSALDGALTSHVLTVTDGDTLDGDLVDRLAGAVSVVASADGRHLYVASRIDDAVTAFEIIDNAGTVALRWIDTYTGVPGLNQAAHLILDSAGQTLYVAGTNDDAIAVFSRQPSSGALSYRESERNGVNDSGDPGGVVDGLDGVSRLVISPDGAHLYAVSATDQAIARFDIEPDGDLSWLGFDDAAGLGVNLSGAAGIAVDPGGSNLYVSARNGDRIVVFARDASSMSSSFGELTVVEEVVQGTDGVSGLLGPRGLVVSRDGRHVYAASQVSGSATWFLRDPGDGSLDFGGVISNESGFVTGLGGATDLVLDDQSPDPLNQLYVVAPTGAAIARFARTNDSSCPASGTNELAAGVGVDIAAGGNVTFELTVNIAATTDGEVENVATVSADPDVDTDPANNGQADTDQVEVVADLRITKTDDRAEFDGLAGAVAVVGDARSLYSAGSNDSAIGVFRRDASTGEVRFDEVQRNGIDGVSGLTDVSDLALSIDGAQLYATGAASNTLVRFDRSPSTSSLTFAGVLQNGTLGINGIGGASAVVVSPDDEHVYVAGRLDNSIAIFRRDSDAMSPDYGSLSFVDSVQNATGGVTNLTEPRALQVSPDGLHLYAVSSIDNSVVVFQRNPNPGSSAFGSISYVESQAQNVDGVAGMGGAVDLRLSLDGSFLYVLGSTNGTVARFSRNPATGELAFIDFKQDGDSGVVGLTGAESLVLSADGLQLYVAATESDAVARFDVQPNGSLAFIDRLVDGDSLSGGGQVQGLDGVSDLVPSPDGDQLYVVSSESSALVTLDRGPAGELSYVDALFDGLGGVAPGSNVIYRIVVENLGPSDVDQINNQVTVVDDFPDTFSSVSWTCTPSAVPGTQCAPSGTGSINDSSVVLPAGARVTYLATATVREDATGRLVNTATVSAVNLQDPVIANNTATDDDTVLSPSIDLIVTVDDGGLSEATPGTQIDYAVEVFNAGDSFATDVLVTDAIPPALFDVSWSCTASPVEGELSFVPPELPIVDPSLLESAGDIVVTGDGLFAYAAGTVAGNGAIEAFLRDPVSGALRRLETYQDGDELDGGQVFQGLQGINDLELSLSGRYLYAAGADSDAVSAFERDSESGLLTPIDFERDGDGGVDGIGGVSELLITPDGVFLFAAGRLDDAIASFVINPANGELEYLGQIVQGVGGLDGLNGITGLAWSDGHLLVVADDNQSLAAFELETSTGLLTPAAIVQNFELGPPNPASSLNGPSDVLAIGSRVFVTAADGNALSEFRFVPSPEVGEPTVLEFVQVVENGVNGITDLVQPTSMAYSERQQRLYVGAAGSDVIHLFSLRTGAPELLAQASSGAIPTLAGLDRVVLPIDGPLYALADTGVISVLARRRGSFCELSGEQELGVQAVEIAPDGRVDFFVSGTIQPNATGSLVYTVEANSRFLEREFDPSNNVGGDVNDLVPSPDLRVFKSDGRDRVVAGTPIDYTIDLENIGPSDALAATFSDLAPIFPMPNAGLLSGSATWSCSANPPLEPGTVLGIGDVAELAGAVSLNFSSDGLRAYAANPELDTLLLFAVDPVSGALALSETLVEGQALGSGPDDVIEGLVGASDVIASASGDTLYAVAGASNSLVVIGRDEDGQWAFQQRFESGVDGVSGLLGPVDLVLTRDQRYVYVAAAAGDAITVFSRDEETGLLTFVERVRDGFGTITPDSNVIRGVRRLHASFDGAHLYTVAPGSNAVATFAIDPDTGSLGYLGALRSGDPGLSGLAGAYDLVAGPGDEQLYVLGRDSSAIVTLDLDAATGLPSFAALTSEPAFQVPEALAIDASGSRLYGVTTGGEVHVFVRDWLDGTLTYRSLAAAGPMNPAALVGLADPAGVYVLSPTRDLARFDELPLSRCLTLSGNSDEVVIDVDLGARNPRGGPFGVGEVIYAATVHPAARGVLTNLAELISANGNDASPGDNAGQDSTIIDAVSDLAVDKTGPAQAVAGESITYAITVTNAGPSDALEIEVIDTLPPELSDVEWTCAASAESSCPASGIGQPDFAATVRVGGQLEITVTGRIDPSFLGTITNRVDLVPEVDSTDPTPADLQDTVLTDVIARADIVATKTTLTTPVVAGEPVEYRLTATNNGPSDAPVVVLSDPLPSSLRNASWSCSGSNGASCPATGAGSPDLIAQLPVGGAVVVRVEADLAPEATGTLTNVVTALAQAPVVDPDPLNAEASTSDPIAVVPDLELMLEDPLDPFDPAGPIAMPYRATVVNLGPSTATGVQLDLGLSAPIAPQTPGCVIPTSDTILCQTAPLGPGEQTVFDFEFDVLPAAPFDLVIDGIVQTDGADPDLANNVDSTLTALRTGPDVDVSIDNGRPWLSPDEITTYTLVVRNLGSIDAGLVDVAVDPGPELLDVSWTCLATGGASCPASGFGPVAETVPLPVGGQTEWTLTGRVDPTLDLSTPQSVLVTAAADTDNPGDDINPLNNLSVQDDPVLLVFFADGFESLVRVTDDASLLPSTCSEWALSPVAGGAVVRIEGRASSGAPLFWVDRARHREQDWIRFVSRGPAGVATDGWQRWQADDGEFRLHLDGRAVTLPAGSSAGLRSGATLPAAPASWQQRALGPGERSPAAAQRVCETTGHGS
jgi:uncharacterized repeat protein (TIGR01451 family)